MAVVNHQLRVELSGSESSFSREIFAPLSGLEKRENNGVVRIA